MIGSLLLSLTLTVTGVNTEGPLLKVHLRLPPSGHPTQGVYLARGELTMGEWTTTLFHLRRIKITGMDPITLTFQHRIPWKEVTPDLLKEVKHRPSRSTLRVIWSPPRGDPVMRSTFRITSAAIHFDDVTLNSFWGDVTWNLNKLGKVTINTTVTNPLNLPLDDEKLTVIVSLNDTPLRSSVANLPHPFKPGSNDVAITIDISAAQWEKLLFAPLVHLHTPTLTLQGNLGLSHDGNSFSIPFEVERSLPLSPKSP